jgi:hypothetical protein
MTRSPDRAFRSAARVALLEEIDRARSLPGVQFESAGVGRRAVLRTGVAFGVAGGLIAAAWLGVSVLQHHHVAVAPPAAPQRATSTPSPSPTQTVPVCDDEMRALINQVTGAGTLTGPITGTFTITTAYGSPVLHLSDLQVGSSTARQVIVSVDLASATCSGNRVGTVAGTISAKPRQAVDLQDSSPQTFSDLSYMKALAIWPQDMGCVASKVSAGTITWHLPAGIKSLAKTNLEQRPAARGDVTLQDGRPVRYTVAANDQIAAVAARFDLTVNELLYLNPLRDRGSDQQLYAGETLNLNPLTRAYFSNSGF